MWQMGFTRRLIRAVRLVARDDQIPPRLRWLAALGLLPVPGPLDEALLVILAAILWFFYRPRLIAAWQAAADTVPIPTPPPLQRPPRRDLPGASRTRDRRSPDPSA
jgi:hypothetical protein